MKRYKHTTATIQDAKNPGLEIVTLDGFLDAMRYLEEREQTLLVEISDRIVRQGFLFLSIDMTARLFMQISALIPCAVLKISVKEGELSLEVSDNNDGDIPERVLLKIAKAAFLAGFSIQTVESRILLTASVSLDRELAVYALSSVSLVERFKKYFKK